MEGLIGGLLFGIVAFVIAYAITMSLGISATVGIFIFLLISCGFLLFDGDFNFFD